MNYPKIWHGNNSLNYNWKSKSNRYKVWHIQLHKNKCFTFNPQELHQAHFADAKSEILKIYLFIYLFLAVLGLRFCARAFSSCGKRGPLFIAVSGPLTIAASLAAEHRLQSRRLSSCGSRAQLLRGMWDLPRPGLEPMSPALAGGFSTTAPPGKPKIHYLAEVYS